MTPALDRELRTASRRAGTWRGRVFSGIAATAVVLFAFYYFSTRTTGRMGATGFASGPQIVAFLTAIGYGAILALAPLLTADTISRERREGTLPLLFLTPLNPKNIISAKAMGGVIQGATILIAVAPVTMIAILSGGVGPYDIIRLAGIWISGLVIALCSGIAVSVSVQDRAPAVMLSVATSLFFGFFGAAIYFTGRLLAGIVETSMTNGQSPIDAVFNIVGPTFVGALGAFALLVLALLLRFGRHGVSAGPKGLFVLALCGLFPILILNHQFDILAIASDRIQNVLAAINQQTGIVGFRQTYGTIGPANSRAAIAAAIFIVAAFCFASIALAYAEWRVALALADAEPGRLAKAGRFLTETKIIRERPLHQRERVNPIVWLTSRTWRMRVAKWVYLGVAMIGITLTMSDIGAYLFISIPIIIVCATAIVASTTFRGEANSGTLELILVTPVREWDLIAGRFWAVFLQTALVILLVVFSHAQMVGLFGQADYRPSRTLQSYSPMLGVFLQWMIPTQPFTFPTKSFVWIWIGQIALTISSCFALSFRGCSPAVTASLSLVITYILAPLLSFVIAVIASAGVPSQPFLITMTRVEIPLAFLALSRLHARLKNRAFNL